MCPARAEAAGARREEIKESRASSVARDGERAALKPGSGWDCSSLREPSAALRRSPRSWLLLVQFERLNFEL